VKEPSRNSSALRIGRNWRCLSVVASLLAITVAYGVTPAAGPAGSDGTAGFERQRVCAEFPFGLLAFVGLLTGVGALWSKALKSEAKVERAERRKRDVSRPSWGAEIGQIRSRDRAFIPDGFLDRCDHLFLAFQKAWRRQDLTPIRPLVSDAIYERLCLQIAEMNRRGTRRAVDDVFVRERSIAQVDVNQHFETITVRFRASAIIYQADAQGEPLLGTQSRQRFTEFWSFVRRPGATTRATGGLLEGHCPNCGTPLVLNETGICGSCQAKVWSGRYDWVLTEITREAEWHARPHTSVPGVAELSRNDPAFCLQQLHDRVSAMFWRRITAWQIGDITVLRNMATARYCESMAEELRPDPDGTRRIPAEVIVGSVDTEGILCNPGFDSALVKISWSSAAERLLADGRREEDLGIGFRVAYFLLTRRHGAQGSVDDGLSSSHCRHCGAPRTDSHSALCEHCASPWLDKDRDWLLADVYLENEPSVESFLSRLEQAAGVRKPRVAKRRTAGRNPSSVRELVAWMVQVMLADGRIEKRESALLDGIVAKHGVPSSELDRLMAAARSGKLELHLPGDSETSQAWLDAMADMALADGRLSTAEKATLQTLGRHLGLSKERIAQTIEDAAERRRRQYANAGDRRSA
jgi:predicted lipid-binding transport protein (Tim44 family)/uncharacterized tellurite resistance protein B-like protein